MIYSYFNWGYSTLTRVTRAGVEGNSRGSRAVELGLVSGVYMISLLENEKIVVVVEMSVVR